jgi:CXXX repeat modification system protein
MMGTPTETSCGKISAAERDEIKGLFQRKLALGELFQSLAKMEPKFRDEMYDKALTDMGETAQKFQEWWEVKAREHQWKSINGASWRVDFETCEVFLVHPS